MTPPGDGWTGKRQASGAGRGAWRPLLDGALAREALDVAGEIRKALQDLPAPPLPEGGPGEVLPGSEPSPAGASLAGGLAGRAIFHAYLGEALASEKEFEKARECLRNGAEIVFREQTTPSLYGGFTGVAWATEHLRPLLFDEEEDPNEAIDGALVEHLGLAPWLGPYDLIYGLVGIGVYALERLPRPEAALLLERVVHRLKETAVSRPEGLAWFTPAHQVPTHQRGGSPEGHFNMGMAHGVPGVIALLGRACERGVAAETALPVLREAVRWLLAQRRGDQAACAFPSWVGPGITPGASRVAWCYGDPGVAIALLGAARAVGERDWEREASGIARRAVRLPVGHGVVDAGLCHGAAGLGHLCNRMAQATGDPDLREAACFWFGRTLEMRKAGEGIAGYSAWLMRKDGTMGWIDDPGLLTGAAGIALALLAAATSQEPSWDRMMLMDLPPFP